MSVGCGAGDGDYADPAICSGPVFHDDVLAPTFREFLRENAGDDVAGAARLIWRYDGDRTGRKFLRISVATCRKHKNTGKNATQNDATFRILCSIFRHQ